MPLIGLLISGDGDCGRRGGAVDGGVEVGSVTEDGGTAGA